MAKYTYNFVVQADIKRLQKHIKDLREFVNRRDFREFIANKCIKELENIQEIMLSDNDSDLTAHSEIINKVQEYKRNHKVEHHKTYIEIYNDTAYSQSDLYWVSPETLVNYPYGISVAKIIEYGTGMRGISQPDWKTNIGTHIRHNSGSLSDGSWEYYNPDIMLSFDDKSLIISYGTTGKFIYQKLLDRIEININDWVLEYAEKEGIM